MKTILTIGRFFSINVRRFVAWWPAVRARGKRSFIVRSGILGLGIPTALLGLLINAIVKAATGKPFLQAGTIVCDFTFGLVLAVFGGMLWGNGIWAFNNRLYDSLVKSR